jgi:hypothetical protein
VSRAAEGQLFLDRLRDVWEDHTACMSKLKDVLKYLVRRSRSSRSFPIGADHRLIVDRTNSGLDPQTFRKSSSSAIPSSSTTSYSIRQIPNLRLHLRLPHPLATCHLPLHPYPDRLPILPPSHTTSSRLSYPRFGSNGQEKSSRGPRSRVSSRSYVPSQMKVRCLYR